MECTTC